MTGGFILPCGRRVLIDAVDMPLAAAYRWYASRAAQKRERYYVAARTKSTTIYLHRLILGAPKGVHVDHKNNDGLDNRRENLRAASRSQNNANKEVVNKTGYRGVTARPNGRFRAEISEHSRRQHLGCFTSAEEAARAYDNAAIAKFGGFARLNFPHGATP